MLAETQTVVMPSPSHEGSANRIPAGQPAVLAETGPVTPSTRLTRTGSHNGVWVTVVPVTWYTSTKRFFDVLAALCLLVLAAPVLLISIILVRLTSRGPAFYSQTRVGKGGRPFTIWKLRSMRHNCELHSGAVWSGQGDPRVTTVGRFLRRSHLDELPQLWNILTGDMSLVGPRPERPEFVPKLEMAIPRYRDRLQVVPGVTGLAQIHLGPDTDLASVERKLAFDLYYIKNLSFFDDVKIVLGTAIHVLRPYTGGNWFFRLTPQSCAEAVGTHIRESGS